MGDRRALRETVLHRDARGLQGSAEGHVGRTGFRFGQDDERHQGIPGNRRGKSSHTGRNHQANKRCEDQEHNFMKSKSTGRGKLSCPTHWRVSNSAANSRTARKSCRPSLTKAWSVKPRDFSSKRSTPPPTAI